MKNFLLLSVFLVSVLFSFAQNENRQYFYVGTFTSGESKGIYLCDFDSGSGEMEIKETFEALDNPSFLKISPDKKMLYAVCRAPGSVEPSGGYVQAYQISQNKKLQFINKQVSHGGDPCHVDVSGDGKFVAIANYGGGSIALYPVSENGALLPASSVIVNQGSSVNENRQTRPHAHSIKFAPAENLVFSADLGTDQLDIFMLDDKKLQANEQKFVKMKPGAGPRHFDFDEKGEYIFVINELNSTISTIKKEGEKWTIIETVSTVPENFEGQNYCADIHVSDDGKFLYGSNRGHNSIVVFAVDDETKKLTLKGFAGVEGDWPRNFSLSPDGNHLLVANQRSGNITLFKINKETGIPEFTGKEIKIPEPVCIEFL